MNNTMIAPTGVIDLFDGMLLTVGSSFQSDIFFQNNNLIPPLLGTLIIKADRLIFRREETGEEETLQYGDELRISGLFFLFLGKILVICAHEGHYRICVRKGRGNASYRRN